MDLGAVIHSYGGPVLFVWAWLQGEAAVIVGGSLARQGYWPWWAVSLVASLGTLRFLGYNVVTALAWALLFTWVGYSYGTAATAAFGRIAHYEAWALAGSIVLGLGVHALTQRFGKRLI